MRGEVRRAHKSGHHACYRRPALYPSSSSASRFRHRVSEKQSLAFRSGVYNMPLGQPLIPSFMIGSRHVYFESCNTEVLERVSIICVLKFVGKYTCRMCTIANVHKLVLNTDLAAYFWDDDPGKWPHVLATTTIGTCAEYLRAAFVNSAFFSPTRQMSSAAIFMFLQLNKNYWKTQNNNGNNRVHCASIYFEIYNGRLQFKTGIALH